MNFAKLAALLIPISLAVTGCGGGGANGGTNSYTNPPVTVVGTITGLNDSPLVLNINGTYQASISGNGQFNLATPVPDTGSYTVTVQTQPTALTCTIVNTIGAAGTVIDNANLVITCLPAAYTISGTITGLSEFSPITLLNNNADPIVVYGGGTFAFDIPVPYNGNYSVTISVPASFQICSITNGTGTNVLTNINNVSIACAPYAYSIFGTVSGLANGQQFTLYNNGADPQVITSNGTFYFSMPYQSAENYDVTINPQPAGQTCTVANSSGTIINSDIYNVNVTCI